jgi:hypothetical protein
MLSYPKAQEKAQEELDRVIGRHRLPEFADRENLPYVNALLKEVLRWHPILPLGLPHATSEEDEYKGMRIPKGSLIMLNAWWVLTMYANVLGLRFFFFLGPCSEIKRYMVLILKYFDQSGSWILTLEILAKSSSALVDGIVMCYLREP